jgi:dTMP kinase
MDTRFLAEVDPMFLVVEGIDGSGKTTQTDRIERMLAEKFGGDVIVRTHEPGGWDGAARAREFVLGGGLTGPWSEFFFFMMDRCEHVERVIRPALSAGKIVVSDRYTPSTLAYQIYGDASISAGAARYAAGISEVIGLPVPDAVFLLDVDVNAAQSRLASRGINDRFDGRGLEFFERVRNGYEKIMESSSGRWIKVDASREEDAVFADIADEILNLSGARLE